MNKQSKNGEMKIELGRSFWFGISFTAGCFGFGWMPFVVIVFLGAILGDAL